MSYTKIIKYLLYFIIGILLYIVINKYTERFSIGMQSEGSTEGSTMVNENGVRQSDNSRGVIYVPYGNMELSLSSDKLYLIKTCTKSAQPSNNSFNSYYSCMTNTNSTINPSIWYIDTSDHTFKTMTTGDIDNGLMVPYENNIKNDNILNIPEEFNGILNPDNFTQQEYYLINYLGTLNISQLLLDNNNDNGSYDIRILMSKLFDVSFDVSFEHMLKYIDFYNRYIELDIDNILKRDSFLFPNIHKIDIEIHQILADMYSIMVTLIINGNNNSIIGKLKRKYEIDISCVCKKSDPLNLSQCKADAINALGNRWTGTASRDMCTDLNNEDIERRVSVCNEIEYCKWNNPLNLFLNQITITIREPFPECSKHTCSGAAGYIDKNNKNDLSCETNDCNNDCCTKLENHEGVDEGQDEGQNERQDGFTVGSQFDDFKENIQSARNVLEQSFTYQTIKDNIKDNIENPSDEEVIVGTSVLGATAVAVTLGGSYLWHRHNHPEQHRSPPSRRSLARRDIRAAIPQQPNQVFFGRPGVDKVTAKSPIAGGPLEPGTADLESIRSQISLDAAAMIAQGEVSTVSSEPFTDLSEPPGTGTLVFGNKNPLSARDEIMEGREVQQIMKQIHDWREAVNARELTSREQYLTDKNVYIKLKSDSQTRVNVRVRVVGQDGFTDMTVNDITQKLDENQPIIDDIEDYTKIEVDIGGGYRPLERTYLFLDPTKPLVVTGYEKGNYFLDSTMPEGVEGGKPTERLTAMALTRNNRKIEVELDLNADGQLITGTNLESGMIDHADAMIMGSEVLGDKITLMAGTPEYDVNDVEKVNTELEQILKGSTAEMDYPPASSKLGPLRSVRGMQIRTSEIRKRLGEMNEAQLDFMAQMAGFDTGAIEAAKTKEDGIIDLILDHWRPRGTDYQEAVSKFEGIQREILEKGDAIEALNTRVEGAQRWLTESQAEQWLRPEDDIYQQTQRAVERNTKQLQTFRSQMDALQSRADIQRDAIRDAEEADTRLMAIPETSEVTIVGRIYIEGKELLKVLQPLTRDTGEVYIRTFYINREQEIDAKPVDMLSMRTVEVNRLHVEEIPDKLMAYAYNETREIELDELNKRSEELLKEMNDLSLEMDTCQSENNIIQNILNKKSELDELRTAWRPTTAARRQTQQGILEDISTLLDNLREIDSRSVRGLQIQEGADVDELFGKGRKKTEFAMQLQNLMRTNREIIQRNPELMKVSFEELSANHKTFKTVYSKRNTGGVETAHKPRSMVDPRSRLTDVIEDRVAEVADDSADVSADVSADLLQKSGVAIPDRGTGAGLAPGKYVEGVHVKMEPGEWLSQLRILSRNPSVLQGVIDGINDKLVLLGNDSKKFLEMISDSEKEDFFGAEWREVRGRELTPEELVKTEKQLLEHKKTLTGLFNATYASKGYVDQFPRTGEYSENRFDKMIEEYSYVMTPSELEQLGIKSNDPALNEGKYWTIIKSNGVTVSESHEVGSRGPLLKEGTVCKELESYTTEDEKKKWIRVRYKEDGSQGMEGRQMEGWLMVKDGNEFSARNIAPYVEHFEELEGDVEEGEYSWPDEWILGIQGGEGWSINNPIELRANPELTSDIVDTGKRDTSNMTVMAERQEQVVSDSSTKLQRRYNLENNDSRSELKEMDTLQQLQQKGIELGVDPNEIYFTDPVEIRRLIIEGVTEKQGTQLDTLQRELDNMLAVGRATARRGKGPAAARAITLQQLQERGIAMGVERNKFSTNPVEIRQLIIQDVTEKQGTQLATLQGRLDDILADGDERLVAVGGRGARRAKARATTVWQLKEKGREVGVNPDEIYSTDPVEVRRLIIHDVTTRQQTDLTALQDRLDATETLQGLEQEGEEEGVDSVAFQDFTRQLADDPSGFRGADPAAIRQLIIDDVREEQGTQLAALQSELDETPTTEALQGMGFGQKLDFKELHYRTDPVPDLDQFREEIMNDVTQRQETQLESLREAEGGFMFERDNILEKSRLRDQLDSLVEEPDIEGPDIERTRQRQIREMQALQDEIKKLKGRGLKKKAKEIGVNVPFVDAYDGERLRQEIIRVQQGNNELELHEMRSREAGEARATTLQQLKEKGGEILDSIDERISDLKAGGANDDLLTHLRTFMDNSRNQVESEQDNPEELQRLIMEAIDEINEAELKTAQKNARYVVEENLFIEVTVPDGAKPKDMLQIEHFTEEGEKVFSELVQVPEGKVPGTKFKAYMGKWPTSTLGGKKLSRDYFREGIQVSITNQKVFGKLMPGDVCQQIESKVLDDGTVFIKVNAQGLEGWITPLGLNNDINAKRLIPGTAKRHARIVTLQDLQEDRDLMKWRPSNTSPYPVTESTGELTAVEYRRVAGGIMRGNLWQSTSNQILTTDPEGDSPTSITLSQGEVCESIESTIMEDGRVRIRVKKWVEEKGDMKIVEGWINVKINLGVPGEEILLKRLIPSAASRLGTSLEDLLFRPKTNVLIESETESEGIRKPLYDAEKLAERVEVPTRQELQGMRLGRLLRRASDLGVESSALDEAQGREDTKAAIIELILDASPQEDVEGGAEAGADSGFLDLFDAVMSGHTVLLPDTESLPSTGKSFSVVSDEYQSGLLSPDRHKVVFTRNGEPLSSKEMERAGDGFLGEGLEYAEDRTGTSTVFARETEQGMGKAVLGSLEEGARFGIDHVRL